MAPFRDPSLLDTASEPGDVLLLASSINLESSEIQSHEKAMLAPEKYPSNPIEVERIQVNSEDLYPTETKRPARAKEYYVRIRKTVKSKMAYVRGTIEYFAPESTPAPPVEDIVSAAAVVEARLYGEALAASPDLTLSLYIKTAHEGDLGGLESALKGLGIPDSEDDEGEERTPENGFVLVNIINNLEGSGEGYIEMYTGAVADRDDEQELAILHCGSEF